MAAQAELLERLIDEHAKLDALLERALAVATQEAWREFSMSLLAQMQREEEQLVTVLPQHRAVRLLVTEHQHLRERVRELDRLSPRDRALPMRDLRDILSAHARVTAAQLGASDASKASMVDTNSATFTGLVR